MYTYYEVRHFYIKHLFTPDSVRNFMYIYTNFIPYEPYGKYFIPYTYINSVTTVGYFYSMSITVYLRYYSKYGGRRYLFVSDTIIPSGIIHPYHTVLICYLFYNPVYYVLSVAYYEYWQITGFKFCAYRFYKNLRCIFFPLIMKKRFPRSILL